MNISTLIQKANKLKINKRYSQAIKEYKNIINKLEKENLDYFQYKGNVWESIGDCYLKLKNYNEASLSYEKSSYFFKYVGYFKKSENSIQKCHNACKKIQNQIFNIIVKYANHHKNEIPFSKLLLIKELKTLDVEDIAICLKNMIRDGLVEEKETGEYIVVSDKGLSIVKISNKTYKKIKNSVITIGISSTNRCISIKTLFKFTKNKYDVNTLYTALKKLENEGWLEFDSSLNCWDFKFDIHQ